MMFELLKPLGSSRDMGHIMFCYITIILYFTSESIHIAVKRPSMLLFCYYL